MLAVILMTAGASQAPAAEAKSNVNVQLAAGDDDVNDPLEGLNRIIFTFNEGFQVLLLRPASTLYGAFTPPPVKEAVSNVLHNIRSPVIFVNDLLQGEGERAMNTLNRFLVNTTLGVAGIMDVAESNFDMPGHDEDFGQTLAVWGVGEGFYLVLPILGPSNPRDAIGKYFVDSYFDPFGYYTSEYHEAAGHARTSVNGAKVYSGVMNELDQVKKTSVDYYAAIRSMYRQKRDSEIRNGEAGDLPPIPEISYEFEDQAPVNPADSQQSTAGEVQLSNGVQIIWSEARIPVKTTGQVIWNTDSRQEEVASITR
ncbi:MAG: VacJ family lipoprotein [Rhodospirillales bacterium]|nr:VacJ family lipoprotein [Rhodospirillales bacterium]